MSKTQMRAQYVARCLAQGWGVLIDYTGVTKVLSHGEADCAEWRKR